MPIPCSTAPCVCPEHLRALLETRDALRGCVVEMRRERVLLERLARRPVPVPRSGPSPAFRAFAEVMGNILDSPAVKETIMEIAHAGDPNPRSPRPPRFRR